LVVIAGLGAVAGAVIVGSMTLDEVVVEHPYEAGLAWDASHHKAEELGWSLMLGREPVVEGANAMHFAVLGPDGMPIGVSADEVALVFERPSGPGTVAASISGSATDGGLVAAFTLPGYGHWVVRARVSHGGQTMDLSGRVYAAGPRT
jgi:nitrogen fixation protein FixH